MHSLDYLFLKPDFYIFCLNEKNKIIVFSQKQSCQFKQDSILKLNEQFQAIWQVNIRKFQKTDFQRYNKYNINQLTVINKIFNQYIIITNLIYNMNWSQSNQDRKQQNSSANIAPQKQLNLQVSQSQAQPFIQDYKMDVIYSNSVSLITYAIIVYFVFVGLELIGYNIQSNVISSYQRSYLIDLQTISSAVLYNRVNKMNMFVDLYRQILAINLQNTSNSNTTIICNQSRYYCENNYINTVSNLIENKYQLIQHNYNSLIEIQQNNIQDALVFVYDKNFTNSYLLYKFNGNQNLTIIRLLIPFIANYTDNGYFVEVVKIIQKQNYTMKVLICGQLPILGSNSKICVLSQGDFEQNIIQKQNQIRTLYDHMLIINQSYVSHATLTETQQQIQTAQEILVKSVLPQDQSFFQFFHFAQCIQQFATIEFMVKNKIRICNPAQLMYFISPLTIFTNFGVQIKPKYYRQQLTSTTNGQPITINFVLFSNATFFQQQSTRIKLFHKKQSIITQVLVCLTVLWLFLMPFKPLKLIGGQLAQNVSILVKMCKAVKMIKNKDELDQQSDLFFKLNNEMMKRNHIFYSTIEHFKYFIWYRKWLYTKNNSRRKALLQQGLSLFGSSDYEPVLMFIYKKQIQRDERLLQNFRRMRKLFTQRFVLLQYQDKNDNNILGAGKHKVTPLKNKKKSLFMREQSQIDKLQGRDYCIIDNLQDFQNRINKQLELMQTPKKNKRFVRFSNDLQQQQRHPFQYKVSKFLLNIPNQPSILKSSQKSIQQQIKKKQQQQNCSSQAVDSSKDQRFVNDFRDPQSDISSKNGQHWDFHIKFDQFQDTNSMEYDQDQCMQLKKFSLDKLDQKLMPIYEHLVNTYNSMIIIKKMYKDKQTYAQPVQYASQLYKMQIQKLKYTCKYLKHKNRQKDLALLQLSRKLITLKKQRRSIKDLDQSRKSKACSQSEKSEKHLQQTKIAIQEQMQIQNKYIDYQFKCFNDLQQKYKIDLLLLERAKLYQIKLLKMLRKPVPYKKLQDLCSSIHEEIRIQAKVILAAEFFQISPHADYEILVKAQQNLAENHTTNSQKRKTLKLISRVLNNRQILQVQQSQVQLIKNYYNYVHKKFYFIADLTDNYEAFIPTLAQIYDNMGQVDVFQILNLGMNQIIQDMIASGNQMKPSKFSQFQAKFQSLHNESIKAKSLVNLPKNNGVNKDNSNSNHTINTINQNINYNTGNNKRIVVEKDFNKILSRIQQEDINLAKFIVLILGGENQSHSKTHQQFQSTSAQNRQTHQFIHQQILSKMDSNYFHMILVGFNLRDYQTRQGKLKKYVRHSHDLFQIDLSKPVEGQFKQLAKYLNK